MPSFKDANGREWVVTIDVPQIKLVRSKLTDDDGKPLNLYRLVEGNMAGLAALLSDPVLLVDTLWVLCEQQALKVPLTDEQFGRAMWGDAILRGKDAFLEGLIDFFPDAKTRDALRRVILKQKELESLLNAEQMKRLDEMDLGAKVQELLPPRDSPSANGSSSSTPASAASSPTVPAEHSESLP